MKKYILNYISLKITNCEIPKKLGLMCGQYVAADLDQVVEEVNWDPYWTMLLILVRFCLPFLRHPSTEGRTSNSLILVKGRIYITISSLMYSKSKKEIPPYNISPV